MSVTAKAMLASAIPPDTHQQAAAGGRATPVKFGRPSDGFEIHPSTVWLVLPPAQILLEAGSSFPGLSWVPGPGSSSWEKTGVGVLPWAPSPAPSRG